MLPEHGVLEKGIEEEDPRKNLGSTRLNSADPEATTEAAAAPVDIIKLHLEAWSGGVGGGKVTE